MLYKNQVLFHICHYYSSFIFIIVNYLMNCISAAFAFFFTTRKKNVPHCRLTCDLMYKIITDLFQCVCFYYKWWLLLYLNHIKTAIHHSKIVKEHEIYNYIKYYFAKPCFIALKVREIYTQIMSHYPWNVLDLKCYGREKRTKTLTFIWSNSPSFNNQAYR